MATSTKMPQTGKELVLTRVFDAPRELVWQAWTDPKRMMQWWGPRYFTAPTVKIDFRVGGTYLADMRAPDGKDYWSRGTYKEIVPLERIVATDSFADAEGHIVPATYYGMSADFALESLVTITFEEKAGKTTLTIRYAGIPEGKDYDGALVGWNETLDKLGEFLEKNRTALIAEPGKQEFTIARVFDAPRELVFKAMTDAELIPRWWGPKRFTTKVERLDARPGGGWRYVQHDDAGKEFGFHGVYHDVKAPERVIDTFEFEGMPGHVSLETAVLEDIGGRTKLIEKSVFQSLADRDGMIMSGMEEGMDEGFDRLADLLKEMQKH